MYYRLDGSNSPAAGATGAKGLIFRVLPLVVVAWHFLIFFFVLVATPVDVFKVRGGTRAGTTRCASMFGWKRCGAHGVSRGFSCGIKSNMGGAAAFAIISIFVTLAAVVVLLLTVTKVWRAPLVVLGTDAAALLTILISWGCVAGAYNGGSCASLGPGRVKHYVTYQGSFGLMVTSWVFEILAIVSLFFIPM